MECKSENHQSWSIKNFILSDSDVEKKEVSKDTNPFYLDKIPKQKLFVLRGQNNIGMYTRPPKIIFNHHSNLTLISFKIIF
jgi:hypothetical protein